MLMLDPVNLRTSLCEMAVLTYDMLHFIIQVLDCHAIKCHSKGSNVNPTGRAYNLWHLKAAMHAMRAGTGSFCQLTDVIMRCVVSVTKSYMTCKKEQLAQQKWFTF